MSTQARLWIGAGLVAVVAAVAFGGWYMFIRDDAPPPATIEDAVSSLRDLDESATATDSPAATLSATEQASEDVSEASTEEASASTAPGTDLTGRWEIAAGSESFVGYRVNEELANIGAKTAVGRTSVLTGFLEFDGSAITAVEVEADLTRLSSDDNRRDRTLGSQGIETGTFPTATFVLTEPIAVGVPAEGETIAVTATGELTLHGVTRPVTLELEGQFVDGFVAVVGSTEILFADYDIDPPSALAVLSIDDQGVMEFQLIFGRG